MQKKIISFIALFTFIFTLVGQDYVFSLRPPNILSPGRKSELTQRANLEKIEADILKELRNVSYNNEPTEEMRISAFQEFILNEANKIGIPVEKEPENLGVGLNILHLNKERVGRIFFDISDFLYSLKNGSLKKIGFKVTVTIADFIAFFTQSEVPHIYIDYNKNGNIKKVFYSIISKEYITYLLLIPVILLIYGWSVTLVIFTLWIGKYAITLFLNTFNLITKNPRNTTLVHEFCHIYQFLLLEKIRKELKLSVTSEQFFHCISYADTEIPLANIRHMPPTPTELGLIVKDLFMQVHKVIKNIEEKENLNSKPVTLTIQEKFINFIQQSI